jgi:hypothetical protein
VPFIAYMCESGGIFYTQWNCVIELSTIRRWHFASFGQIAYFYYIDLFIVWNAAKWDMHCVLYNFRLLERRRRKLWGLNNCIANSSSSNRTKPPFVHLQLKLFLLNRWIGHDDFLYNFVVTCFCYFRFFCTYIFIDELLRALSIVLKQFFSSSFTLCMHDNDHSSVSRPKRSSI